MHMLRLVDLFSGIGAFHQAATATGAARVTFACDIDPVANAAYQRNHGLLPMQGDIGALEKLPVCDVVTAGFPCQDFSLMGNRKGLGGGRRGNLVFEVLRLLGVSGRPPVVIFENVARLLTDAGGETLVLIRKGLEALGYHCHFRLLNAVDFGLPQMRKRLFMVAFQSRHAYSAFRWPEPRGMGGEGPETVAPFLDQAASPRHTVSDAVRERTRQAAGDKAPPPEQGPTVWYTNKSGSVSLSRQVHTLRAKPSHNYILIDGWRRPSETELLRFQGFPDTFDLGGRGYSIAVRLIGNSIPVPIAEALLREVVRCMV